MLKRDNGHSNNVTMEDVFMPRDDPVDTLDEEIDEINRELEDFKRFCFMAKPLENQPMVAMKVNLKDLTLNRRYVGLASHTPTLLKIGSSNTPH